MTNIYNTFFSEKIWKKVNQKNKDLLADFCLELKQRQRAESTIRAYSYDIRGFFCYIYRYFDNQFVLDLNKRDIRKYSLFLIETCNLSNARHNRVLSAIRSMLDFAENEDDEYDYNVNVANKVKTLPKEPIKKIIFLSNKEVLSLVEKLIAEKQYQKATLLALSYDSAGRRGELVQVNKHSFFDKNKNNTNVVIGKGNKRFVLLYFSLTKRCADLWLEQRGDDDIDSLWVIGSGKNRRPASSKNLYDFFVYIRKILEKDSGKKIRLTPHSLRHSALQNLSDGSHYICLEKNNGQGYELEKLKLLANHSSIETTSNYLKDRSKEELEAMFKINIESS